MNKSKYFTFLVVLVVLIVTSCSNPASEVMETPTLNIITPTATAAKIEFGKLECQDKGHITAWGLSETWLDTYTSSFDEDSKTLGMTLVYKGNSIEGILFYPDKPDELKINGCLEKNRNFVLYVYTENNERLATIQGEFPEIDPLGGFNGGKLEREVITGTWIDNLTSQRSSIYLKLDYAVSGTFEHQYEVAGVTDDEIIDKAARDFLNAVASDNKEFVAGMIEYPISAIINGTKTEIKKQEEFIFYYDQIFTNEFKSQLDLTRPSHMFAKWSGIMLGRGDIWFNAYGKIIAINN